MTSVDVLRNSLIEKILTISDKDYLIALQKLIQGDSTQKEVVKFTEEQKLMIFMSNKDIEEGKVVSQSDVDKSDLEWIKGL